MDQMPLFGRRCWAVGSSMQALRSDPGSDPRVVASSAHGSTFRQSRLPCPISMASRPVKLLTRELKPHGAFGSGPRNLGRSGRGSQCPPVWWMPCMPSKLLWNGRSSRGWSSWCGMGTSGLKCRWSNLMPSRNRGYRPSGNLAGSGYAAGMVGPIGSTDLAGSFPYRPMPTHPPGRAPSGLPATE